MADLREFEARLHFDVNATATMPTDAHGPGTCRFREFRVTIDPVGGGPVPPRLRPVRPVDSVAGPVARLEGLAAKARVPRESETLHAPPAWAAQRGSCV